MKTVRRILAVALLVVTVLVVGYLVYTETVRRILAVALLVVTVLVVGYLVYTGSRTASVEESTAILEVVYEQVQNI